MNQLKTEKIEIHGIPVILVHPPMETGKPAILYHGWSSRAEYQLTKASILAVNGYTVFIPEALYHGERGALKDFYQKEDYDIFWETIFRNMEEFPFLSDYIKERYSEKPFILGHSMGGLSVLGIGSAYGKDVKGIVSFNGSGDWLLTHLFIQARFGIYMKKDWPLYDEIEKKSPMAHLDTLKDVPIFMTNGDSDGSIDPRAQAHFYEELMKAGGKAERVVYPLLGHFVTTNMMDDGLQWMEKVRP